MLGEEVNMWTWIDLLAMVVSVLAFAVSLWTRYSDRKWKEEVEGRRPFTPALQKLSLILTRHEFAVSRAKSARSRLRRRLDMLEQQYGRKPDLDPIRRTLEDAEKAQEESREATTQTKQSIDKMWKLSRPSGKEFAEVQRWQAAHEKMLAS